MHWTRTSLTILIDFMRKNEILWKITCSDFQKRDLRAALINRSLLINKSSLLFFSHEIPGITEAELNARIRSLKNQYWREKWRQKQSQKSGAGADDLYIPTLWCFDMLSILGDGPPSTRAQAPNPQSSNALLSSSDPNQLTDPRVSFSHATQISKTMSFLRLTRDSMTCASRRL